jgi:hypothetical protein
MGTSVHGPRQAAQSSARALVVRGALAAALALPALTGAWMAHAPSPAAAATAAHALADGGGPQVPCSGIPSPC